MHFYSSTDFGKINAYFLPAVYFFQSLGRIFRQGGVAYAVCAGNEPCGVGGTAHLCGVDKKLLGKAAFVKAEPKDYAWVISVP